ncbi:hypothetical protein OUHCRE11_40130 [Enterobacter asburiae]|nr:hypothetical protein ENTKAS01_17270 [Enterobacter sp. AS-1]
MSANKALAVFFVMIILSLISLHNIPPKKYDHKYASLVKPGRKYNEKAKREIVNSNDHFLKINNSGRVK